MFLWAKLTKLQSKENFDTNLDPDPEWLLIIYVICVVIPNEARVMLFVIRYHTFYLSNN